MRFKITLDVNPDETNKRLDDWLTWRLVDETRESVHAAIAAGGVTVAGEPMMDPRYRVSAGEAISFRQASEDGTNLAPEPAQAPAPVPATADATATATATPDTPGAEAKPPAKKRKSPSEMAARSWAGTLAIRDED